MKYTGYTKPQLIEWCQCLEHNYNVEKERFERVSGIAQKLAAQIVELRALLNEVRDILYNYKHCFQAKDLEKTNDLLSGIHAVFDENVNNMFQTEQDVANNVAKSDLQHLQAENNRLKTTLKNLKSLMLDPDCVLDRGDIYVMVRAIDEALNESEE